MDEFEVKNKTLTCCRAVDLIQAKFMRGADDLLGDRVGHAGAEGNVYRNGIRFEGGKS